MSETLTIQLPEAVSREVRRQAANRGITPATLLAELAMLHAGDEQAVRDYFMARAARSKPGAMLKAFGPDRAGGEPPRPGDEIV